VSNIIKKTLIFVISNILF